MILVFFFLNLLISIANAWGCGRTWDSTKAKGGGAHFMNWMGATMAASGFTWCYLVVIGFIATNIHHTDKVTKVVKPYLDPVALQAFCDLGYLVIILPILGSGLAITVASWRAVARRRSAGNIAITGWNTFAQVHNMYTAAQAIPGVWERLGGFFGGKSSSNDGKNKLVIALVAIAVLGGLLTTYAIVQGARRGALLSERLRA